MLGKRKHEIIEVPFDSTDETHHLYTRSTKRLSSSSARSKSRRAPLTKSNLQRLNQLHNMPLSKSQSPKRRQSQSPSKSPPDMQRLVAYNILRPGDATRSLAQLPDELRALVEDFRQAPLPKEVAQSSGRAKRVVKLQPAVVRMKEEDGFDALARLLFFQPWVWGSEDFPGINAARRHNLNNGFIPTAPSEIAAQLGPLTTPQPDLMFGYMNNDIVEGLRDGLGDDDEPLPWEAPLTNAEELQCLSRRLQVATDLLFPFFTVQWKSARMNRTHVQAQVQCLADAATILNANHALFALANFNTDTIKHTNAACHFSSTVDLQTANMYIHYRSSDSDDPAHPKYNTKTLFECNIKNEEEVDTWRRYMKRIYHWAMGPRLAAIKAAISSLSGLPPDIHGLARSDDAQSTVSGSNATSSAVTVAHELRDEARMLRLRLAVFPDQPVLISDQPTPPFSDIAVGQEEERTAKRKR